MERALNYHLRSAMVCAILSLTAISFISQA